jgi:hypothetical protein
MIGFYGQGGLGNQLFQYAAARSLSVKHGCPVVLDPHWFYSPTPGDTPRALELLRYRAALRLASATEQSQWKWMRGKLSRHLRLLHPLHLVCEKGDGVHWPAVQAPNHSYLLGHWQSEAYFAGIRGELLEELVPTAPPGVADLSMMHHMRSGTAVSVHVRRGDYLSLKSAANFHGVCSLNYYRAAINLVAQRVSEPVFFVFSDDPEWTRANLAPPFPTHYVSHNGPENAFQDLRLMSMCQHHIMANSSFSWWGAWLAPAQSGLVVAPANWYASGRPCPDLIPARWLQIEA